MSYKLCPECQQPILKEGQTRKHADDYRHATGCPADVPVCPQCLEDATYQTPDGTYWDSNAHHWRIKEQPNGE